MGAVERDGVGQDRNRLTWEQVVKALAAHFFLFRFNSGRRATHTRQVVTHPALLTRVVGHAKVSRAEGIAGYISELG